MPDVDTDRCHRPRPTFGRWLLQQQQKTDTIGVLAKAAASDPRFPKDGDYTAISVHLNKVQADSDMHIALDDAQSDWSAAQP